VPESERFLSILTSEVRDFLPRLNRHPSIVLWTGGNEHIHYWDELESGTPTMEATKGDILSREGFFFDREHMIAGVPIYENIGLKQMASLADELGGGRPFEPTSGMEGEGEPHGIWSWNPKIGDWRMRDYDTLYDYWNDQREHFYSEVGVDSIATRAAIEYVFNTDEPAMPEPGDPVWIHHKAFGACWPIDREHEANLRSDLWLDLASIDKLFGRIDNLDDLITASHWMQAEGGRYVVEELRRKMPHTCGVIWWGCNEPWPNLAGNQLIDYFGEPHPVLFWKGNAFRPTILSLRYKHCVARAFKPGLWISHDGRGPFDGTYTCTVEDLDTGELERYRGAVSCPEYASVLIKRLNYVRLKPGKRLWVTLILRDMTGAEVHANTYLFASDEDEAPLRPLLPRIKTLLDATATAGAVRGDTPQIGAAAGLAGVDMGADG
jgi:beta-mannosidase